ncbi:hypothetical protein PYCCODRAFT_367469 [Trametes coccinea BRFM310]|uniref:F-box domain-containing protein n=1 Tax=Trametes coccinea (strain BRFM310) TaxID=1353009 RepID=A0A1Y2J4W4_TRAC3|nr:hypothetical protein PYCCODRAFT_367469 [Trametes coccinea BRFM310]
MNPETSATHRCLLVNEIFHQIASELYYPDEDEDEDGSGGPPNRSALLPLAQTCKALHDAVLPVLWQDMDDVVPLLKLLPAGSWSEYRHLHGQVIFQVDDPDALDWTRYLHHAQHVRRLHWHNPSTISLLALSVLSTRRPSSSSSSGPLPLLPNLRELTWHETRPQFFPFAHLFLAPSLRDLHVHTARPDPAALMALFEHAAARCKNVETLDLCTDAHGDQEGVLCEGEGGKGVGNALAKLLGGLRALREYSGDVWLPAGCVEALAGSKRLELLGLHMAQREVEAVAKSLKDSDGAVRREWFGALKMLGLNVPRLDESTKTLVGSLQTHDLIDILLVAHHQADTHTLKAHLDAIAHAPSHAALTSVQIDFDTLLQEKMHPPTLDLGAALRPLYALPQIEHLIVRGPLVTLSEHTLADIANAWPALEVLSLISTPIVHPSASAYCPALADLAPLARKCARLHALELHLNAVAVPAEPTVARLMGAEASRYALRCFTAFDAPVANPERVAAYLRRLFPEVREVEYRGAAVFPRDAQVVFEENWRRVQDYCRGKAPPVHPLMRPLNA